MIGQTISICAITAEIAWSILCCQSQNELINKLIPAIIGMITIIQIVWF